MLDAANGFGDVGQVVQLALAPAFLLTSIAGMLGVMTGRLARIIDRGRYLEALDEPADSERLAALVLEQSDLERRRYLASAAITACTFSALLVCLVIVVLFVKAMFAWQIN